MATSRSPLAYQMRKGLEPTPKMLPRFQPCSLLVNQYPTGSTTQKSSAADGFPPPLRAEFYPWFSIETEEG